MHVADGENAVPNISSAASTASAAVPQKASPSQSSSAASVALSDEELAQLTEELSVLSEQPRSQMVCALCTAATSPRCLLLVLPDLSEATVHSVPSLLLDLFRQS